MHEVEKKLWIAALKEAKKQDDWQPVCDFAGIMRFGRSEKSYHPPFCPHCILTQFVVKNERPLRKELKLKPKDRTLTLGADFDYFREFNHFAHTCGFLEIVRQDLSDVEDETGATVLTDAQFLKQLKSINHLELQYWSSRVIRWLKFPVNLKK